MRCKFQVKNNDGSTFVCVLNEKHVSGPFLGGHYLKKVLQGCKHNSPHFTDQYDACLNSPDEAK